MKHIRTLALAIALGSVALGASPRLLADTTPAPAGSTSVKPPPKVRAKVAFVDLERCIGETEDGLRAKALLKKFSDRRQMAIASVEDRLKREQDELQDLAKQANTVKPGTKAFDELRTKTTDAAIKYQKNLQIYNDTIKKMNGEIAQREDELYSPIEKKVKSILSKIGEAEAYDVILDKKQMPVGKPAFDLTERVIREYNWGK